MGKLVFVYFNGDSYKRKCIVVNYRDMWSFEFFLNIVVVSFCILVWEIRILGGRYWIRMFDDL